VPRPRAFLDFRVLHLRGLEDAGFKGVMWQVSHDV
jgi:hypothetical protein